MGVGADADISVYAIDPTEVNVSSQYKLVRQAFRRAAYTIKEGKILVKNGEVVDTVPGKTLWVDPEVPQDTYDKMVSDLKEKFERYYTMQMSNYPIGEEYLRASKKIEAVAGS
jgi:formylmethanofuran dehydrogenase subunit A